MQTALAILLLSAASVTWAQELEPHACSPNPVGANFFVTSVGSSIGGVLFDPTAPFDDVEAHLNNAAVGYGRSFGAFGRSATALLAVPYVWGEISGNVGEDRGKITRSSLADTRLKLSINVLGGAALSTTTSLAAGGASRIRSRWSRRKGKCEILIGKRQISR